MSDKKVLNINPDLFSFSKTNKTRKYKTEKNSQKRILNKNYEKSKKEYEIIL